MRILITGAQGMLGSTLAARLAGEHDVLGVDLADFDITDADATAAAMARFAPELVCHCAAFTDVDGCERDPATAFRVNALGTWNIAAACSQTDAGMLYISTDFVFDGEKAAPYTEYDAPRPLGVYGASKLAGECHVRELARRHFIVRSAWLFAPHGRNFVLTMLRKAREQAAGALRVVGDQLGSPTAVGDLADAIARHLVGSRQYGTYHITNAGACSWAELAAETLRLAGSAVAVQPIAASEWSSPTRRPAYSALRHLSLEMQGRDDLRPWQAALAEVVEQALMDTRD